MSHSRRLLLRAGVLARSLRPSRSAKPPAHRSRFATLAVRTGSTISSSALVAVAGVGCGLSLALGGNSFTAPLIEAKAAEDSTPVVDYRKVRETINKILDENDSLGPTFVRLAWHSSGSYDKKSDTGGSDGATMRYSPERDYGANAGLNVARDALESVKLAFPEITYADLWTLAGVTAIEYMSGPKIPWRPGRRDKTKDDGCPPDGRLPDADKGSPKSTIEHVRHIFYRMGFSDQEIVALAGAHALGRCHVNASGYTGPWTRAETTFSNEYYRELLENVWTLKRWEGPDQFEDPTGDLMMLPSDMALIWDKDFRKYVELYAKDEDAFFRDFGKAFQKLEELGVKALRTSSSEKPWYKFW